MNTFINYLKKFFIKEVKIIFKIKTEIKVKIIALLLSKKNIFIDS